jgi:hypothetical protein
MGKEPQLDAFKHSPRGLRLVTFFKNVACYSSTVLLSGKG